MFQLDEKSIPSRARIKVIGVGGGGGNAIKTMRQSGLTGVQFIVANTDIQALEEHEGTDVVIQMGAQLTGGLGAGANPEIGRQAAIESCEQIGEALKGANMVFITAGMGGGTGTGATGVIARLAKEQGALTVGVVTRPFFFEGQRRSRHAEMGIQFLKENVDTLIVIPNQKLLTAEEEDSSLLSAFKSVDNILLTAVRGIVDLIHQKGLINLDFADVKTIMSEKGLAIIGMGSAKGEGRALRAGQMAIASPLLEESSFKGASGLIINISGGSDLSLKEVNQVADLISSSVHPDAEIIFGAIVDSEKAGATLNVTVIATGFEGRQPEEKAENPELTKHKAPALDVARSQSKAPALDVARSQSKAPATKEETILKDQQNTETNKLSSTALPAGTDFAQSPSEMMEEEAVNHKAEGGRVSTEVVANKSKESDVGSAEAVANKSKESDVGSAEAVANKSTKLPRDILLEKARAYQNEFHQKQKVEKDNHQLSMNMGTKAESVDQAPFQSPPFKKQKFGLIGFFRKSDKTL